MDLERIRESMVASERMIERLREETAPSVERAGRAMVDSIRNGGKILLCGNGGSAADAQHVATELVVRYLADRPAIPAIALTVDTSILTAASNDLGFANVFSRQVEAIGREGDVLLAISTSAMSRNVIRAAETARARGLVTVALTGESPGELHAVADYVIAVPSDYTPRIQEGHLVVEHILCQMLEAATMEQPS